MRPLLALKKAGIQYTENKSTTLPGFEGYSRILGDDYKMNAPGFGFAFGVQPGDKFTNGYNRAKVTDWLNRAANSGWISNDTFLNQQFTQTRSDRVDGTVSFEPFSDLKLDLTLFRDYTQNYSEFFKYAPDSTGNYSFQHLNPMMMGSYSISYLPIKTLFTKIDTAGYNSTYKVFTANRPIISQRLGRLNPSSHPGTPYTNPSDTTTNPAYADGYGPLSQDVLIPAFLAAYEKRNPNSITLNPFQTMPKPNWRIAYTGLSKIKWIKKYITNITISNGYNSTLTVSSYQTNLSYVGNSRNPRWRKGQGFNKRQFLLAV